MNTKDLEKSKAHITVELIEYMENSVITKTIMHKSTGNVSAISFDSGEGLTETTSPFDTFLQIIDGEAHLVIDGKPTTLKTGESIIVPAHKSSKITPNGRFKMISTVIKSGYEKW